MKKEHKAAFDMLRTVAQSSNIKTKRSFSDFFADRIVQAGTEQTILAAVERLCKSVDVQIEDVYKPVVAEFFKNLNALHPVLVFIRQYPSVVAMLCTLKKEEYEGAISGIDIGDVKIETGVAVQLPKPEVSVKINCLSPFAHGGDNKAGNATLFRRQNIMCSNGAVLSLPFYSGNALRGTMRDVLSDHFIASLGLVPRRDNPPVFLWFFHVLYAGGALEEAGTGLKMIMSKLGNNGAVSAGGIYEFRDTIPHISLLGAAIGNRILSGRVNFNDFRPRCIEYGTGEKFSSELFDWTFLTRREDHEEHEEHHGMIANAECLKSGVIMDGGIEISQHATEMERSALGCGLELLKNAGYLGAENRRGCGKVEIEIGNMPDPEPYKNYLRENKNNILKYLAEVNACASDLVDSSND